MPDSPLITALLQPDAYPHPCVRPVQLQETHISWVLLTGDYVYKIKKPVNFGFLDFTTLAQRRAACAAEVRLNRRLSPEVYLGVAPITRTEAGWRLGGTGEVVEVAVKMRQLSAAGWLADWVTTGRATPALMARISDRLAAFHAAAATNPTIADSGGWEVMRRNATENFDQTAPYQGITLTATAYAALHAYTTAFLTQVAPLMAARAAAGRIRDCHGDLHANHVHIDEAGHIAFIDAIEFNDRFRYSDVGLDLAFLAMDLDYLGRPDLSQALAAHYIERSGDQELKQLLTYFKCYRAYVRGKVESFRLDESGLPLAERARIQAHAARYFDLARSYIRPRRPLLLFTTGLMGVGKSSLAQALGEHLPAEVLSADLIRKTLAGLAPDQSQHVPWGTGIYSEAFHARTYAALHDRARACLAQGRPVILDASYRRPEQRAAARQVAESQDALWGVLDVRCPEALVRQRLLARQRSGVSQGSDGRLELLNTQMAHYAPPDEVPAAARLVVDASLPLAETVQQTLTTIYTWLLQHGALDC